MKDLREELNQVTDALNDSIEKVEGALYALKLGVAVQIPLDEEHTLSYEKHKGGWGLYVLFKNPEAEKRPLRKASRECRVRAAEVYDALLEELFTQAEAQVSIVKDARDRTEEFVTRASLRMGTEIGRDLRMGTEIGRDLREELCPVCHRPTHAYDCR